MPRVATPEEAALLGAPEAPAFRTATPEEAALLGTPERASPRIASPEEEALLGPGGVGRPTGFMSAFVGGLKRGGYNEMSNLKAAGGLLLRPFDSVEGDAMIDNAIKLQNRGTQQNPRGIERIEDIDEWGDVPVYLGDTLGEGVVSIGTSLLGGGLTGVVAKTLAKGAVKAGVQRAVKAAPVGGMLGYNIATESGATASELREATGKTEWLKSLGAGIVKGSLESVTPMILGKAIGIGADDQIRILSKVASLLKGSTAGRIVKGGATIAVTEGATEAAQEMTDILARSLSDEDYQFLSSETGSRLLNATVAGAITGAPFGALVSTATGKVAKEEDIPPGELPESGVEPQVRPRGTDLGPEVASIKTALSADEDFAVKAALTLGDLANGATPGSKLEHSILGFQPLPEGLRGIAARTSRERLAAPLEIVARDMKSLRENLAEAAEDSDLEEKTKKRVKQQAEESNLTVGYLLSAVHNRDASGVPTAQLTTRDAEPMAETAAELAGLNEDLLPHGFKVSYFNTPERVQLQRMDGSPVINVPNDLSYRDLLVHVMKADRNLSNSGFYKTAAMNEAKLITMQGDGIDLSYMKTLSGPEKVVEYRKAFGLVSAAEQLPKAVRQEFGVAAAEMEAGHVKFNSVMRTGYTILQWAQRNPELTPLQNYVDVLQTEKAGTMRIQSRADGILKRFMRLGKEQQDAANDYLEALDRMTYLRPEEVREETRKIGGKEEVVKVRVPRMPTADEDRLLIKGMKYRKNKTPLLRETYGVVKEMQLMMDDVFRDYVQFAAQEARYRFHKPKALQQALENLQKMTDTYFTRPRFPFTAVGNFVAAVRSPDGKLLRVLQSETSGDQKRDVALLQNAYGGKEDHKVIQYRIPDQIAKWTALPDMVLRDLAAKGYLAKVSKEHRQLLEYLAVTGPANRKRFIAGMSPKKRSVELQRAFAMWSQNVANAFFEMKAGPALEREVQVLARGIGKAQNTDKLGLLVTALGEHMDYLFNPPNEWDGVRNFAFMWHIAFNVKSALLNTTQVPVVTLPFLSARFGSIRAIAALQRAYLDKRTLYSKEATANLDDQMSRLLTKAISDGKVDESFATELAGLAEGTNLNRMMAGSKYDRFMKEVSFYGSYLFAYVEKMSRSVTFRAAVQLALDVPNSKYLQDLGRQQPRAMVELARQGFTESESQAYLAGIDAINQTMFEYAKWNRPSLFRGKKAPFFTFWMFTQGMLHFAVHSPGAVRYWLIMLAMAGVMGLPGAEDLDQLVNALAQRLFGKDFKPSREARLLVTTLVDPFIRENFNPAHRTAADLLLHGLSKDSFGLAAAADAVGMPWVPSIDMSRSLGMGRVLPVGPELLKPGIDYNRALAETTERVSGAAFGPMFAILEALRADNTDFRRWEKAMPAALRGFIRAGRFEQEERERGLKGDTIVEFDPHDPLHKGEMWAVAMGFTPTRLSKKWDQLIELRDAVNYWDYRRTILLQQLDYAVYMKDPEGRSDVMAAVKRFNGQLPDYVGAKRITADTIRKSLREKARLRALGSQGIPGQKSDRPAAQYFKELYSEELPQRLP